MWWEKQDNLIAKNNCLFIGDHRVSELAEKYGTPLYVYNAKRIRENYYTLNDALKSAGFKDYRIHYAMKANNHIGMLKILKELGAGIDATSPGEVSLASKIGFSDSDIIFTGTSLGDSDLAYLSQRDVLINFDSISSIRRFKSKQDRRVGLRINTGVGLGRTPWITTGGTSTKGIPVKFGLSGKNIIKAAKLIKEKNLGMFCIHHHVGSDWLGDQIDNYFLALSNLIDYASEIQSVLGYSISVLDLGGGYGVPHWGKEENFPVYDFFHRVFELVTESGLNFSKVVIEPGNFLVGDAGTLVVQVNTVEQKNNRTFVGVNCGLNVFNSPSLYGIYHEIIVTGKCRDLQTETVTVAGNICEAGDLFAIDRELPKINEGDYLAILNSGAYGSTMSSEYNLRPKAKEVLVE